MEAVKSGLGRLVRHHGTPVKKDKLQGIFAELDKTAQGVGAASFKPNGELKISGTTYDHLGRRIGPFFSKHSMLCDNELIYVYTEKGIVTQIEGVGGGQLGAVSPLRQGGGRHRSPHRVRAARGG